MKKMGIGVVGCEQLLQVNLATVRRKKSEKIREKEGKTDKEPIRKGSRKQREQSHKGANQ